MCPCPATSQRLGRMEILQGLHIFLRTPNPTAVTEFSSMNDEQLNGAQGVSKLEHQGSSMSLRLGS